MGDVFSRNIIEKTLHIKHSSGNRNFYVTIILCAIAAIIVIVAIVAVLVSINSANAATSLTYTDSGYSVSCSSGTYGSGLCASSSSWGGFDNGSGGNFYYNGSPSFQSGYQTLTSNLSVVSEYASGQPSGPALANGSNVTQPAKLNTGGCGNSFASGQNAYAGHLDGTYTSGSFIGTLNNSNVWTGSCIDNTLSGSTARWVSDGTSGSQTETSNSSQAQTFIIGQKFSVKSIPAGATYFKIELSGICADDTLASVDINANSSSYSSVNMTGGSKSWNFWQCGSNNYAESGYIPVSVLNASSTSNNNFIRYYVNSIPGAWGLLVGKAQLEFFYTPWSVQTHSTVATGSSADNAVSNERAIDGSGSSSTFGNNVNAYPGDYVAWGMTAWNNGPNSTDAQVLFHRVTSSASVGSFDTNCGYPGSTSCANFASWNSGQGTVDHPPHSSDTVAILSSGGNGASRPVTASEAGNTYCMQFSAQPWDSVGTTSDGGNGSGQSFGSLGAYQGADSCAHIPYNYNLAINGNGSINASTGDCSNIAQVGSSGSITFTINSQGTEGGNNATISHPISYKVFDNNGNQVAASSSTFTMNPNDSKTITVSVPSPSNISSVISYKIEVYVTLPDGDVVNLGNGSPIEINSDNEVSTQTWVSSCVEFMKNPSLQINGTDSEAGASSWGTTSINNGLGKSGGFIGSSYSGSASLNQGSWSQYGLLANNSAGDSSNADITNFGSAGWTAGGTFSNGNASEACLLWGANTTSINGSFNNCYGASSTSTTSLAQGGNFGSTNRSISLPNNGSLSGTGIVSGDPLSGYSSSASSLNIYTALNAGSNNAYSFVPAGGTMTISSSYPNGLTELYSGMTLYIQGNVDITSNLSVFGTSSQGVFNGKYTSLDQITSLTIYATGNIYIDQSVTNIDASLVAGGYVQTCYQGADGSATLSESGACDNQLNINGAIVSQSSPRFYRTYGADAGDSNGNCFNMADGTSDTCLNVPSEIVNYNPASFLVPYYHATVTNENTSTWSVVSETSLPARY